MSYSTKTLLLLAVSLSLSAAAEKQRIALYFGGSGADVANSVAVDADGNAYVAGQVTQQSKVATAFVSKTKPDGSDVTWTVYLDGRTANAIAIDATGGVWAGGDGFLAKLNAGDGRVERSLATGTVTALAVDAVGGVYAAGDGWIEKYVGGEQSYRFRFDGLVRGLAVDGEGAAYVVFGQSLGRLRADGSEFASVLDLGFGGAAVAVDGSGAAYVTGENAQVVKVAPAGDTVAVLVSLAGVLEQEGRAIALDGFGNIYVAGWTSSSDFARSRGWHGERDGFVVKLDASGNVLDTEFVGTAGRDMLLSLAVTPRGDVYAAGRTESAGLGSGPLAQWQGGSDALLVKLEAAGSRGITGTTTTLATTPAGIAAFGQPVVLTASVSPSAATGKVTFYDGTVVLGSGTLAGGVASFSTPLIAAGTRTIRAMYLGDVNYSASVSGNVALVVGVTPSISFAPGAGASTPVGTAPNAIATGDFNGDGRVDLAVVNANSNNVSVLLSNGLGGFTPASGSPLAAGTGPNSVVVADFNLDGKADLAIANTNSNSINVYLGNGSGGFSSASGSPFSNTGGPFSLAAADVNGDGFVDLLTTNFGTGTLGVLLGSGTGTFSAAAGSPIAIGGQPGYVLVADFNGDGKPDAAVSNFSANNVSIFLGSGTGGFTAAPGGPVAVGVGPVGMASADFNADGKADLAVTNFGGQSVSILLGAGTGGFSAAPGSPISVSDGPRFVVAVDYNGDGKQDLVVANFSSSAVTVLQGNGAGGFVVGPGSPMSAGSSPTSLALGDFNGDGRMDLVVVNAGNNAIATIPGVGATPLVVSATPANPTTATQTVSFVVRDADGYANLQRIYFLINPNASIPQNTCHGFYERATNSFYLFNDALTGLLGPLQGGSGGSIQNSQCVIQGTGSGFISASGAEMTFTMRMTMQGLYATTTEKIYLWAVDEQSLGTGWVQTGSWVLGAPVGDQAPTVVSGTPTNPTSSPQTFSFTVRDLNGSADINRVYFLINPTPTIPVNTCHGLYDRATNALYLFNDSLTAVSGPLVLGTSGTIQNSQCSVDGLTSALISGAGTDVTFNLGMSLRGGFASSTQNIYIWVVDKGNSGTGWVKTGTWGNAVSQQPPSVISATPSTTSGSPQTFNVLMRDLNGYTDINRVYFLVNSSTTIPTNTCHGFYQRSNGAFYLFNDALTTVVGPLVAGSGGSISNSQCSIAGATSTVSGSGTDLTLNMTMSLLGSYGASQQKLYIWAIDTANTGSGWVQVSTWGGSVAPQPPTLPSVTPSSTASATQTFTLTGRDANGSSDIRYFYFLINTDTSIPTGSCHGLYDRATNSILLFDNTLTAVTSFVVGTSNTVQNSQCRINGSGTSVTASGTDVVLNLNITRQGSYATGAKKLYIWVVDNANTGTGWVQASNWNL
ncbi:MAG TPA: FG-GAP-like repeat-containing protein [Bryobacteraceae bacterium]|nr:FG-GAP-like repeat-containing protein [Bryobacteraceae bacterium]